MKHLWGAYSVAHVVGLIKAHCLFYRGSIGNLGCRFRNRVVVHALRVREFKCC